MYRLAIGTVGTVVRSTAYTGAHLASTTSIPITTLVADVSRATQPGLPQDVDGSRRQTSSSLLCE